MDSICRICLGNESLTSIFTIEDSLTLSQKIMLLTQIEIQPGDNLPSTICAACVKRLNDSYKFRTDCVYSDSKLRKELLTKELDSQDKSDHSVLAGILTSDEIFTLESNRDNINGHPKKNDITPILLTDIKNNISDLKNGKYARLFSEDVPPDSSKQKEEPDTQKISILKANKTQKQQCVTCGKVMSSRFRLKMHMRIHTGERPFTCAYCSKKFSLSQNLKVHMRVHTGEKPLHCSTCGKAFAQSAGLVAHTRLHTGETPYRCTLCPASFRTPGHLQYHIRQHTGEKNFECTVCGRAFITRSDLKQHSQTHTGEKPHVCCICGMRLARASHLKRHMAIHSGNRPFTCKLCPSAFVQKGDLEKHKKKHDHAVET